MKWLRKLRLLFMTDRQITDIIMKDYGKYVSVPYVNSETSHTKEDIEQHLNLLRKKVTFEFINGSTIDESRVTHWVLNKECTMSSFESKSISGNILEDIANDTFEPIHMWTAATLFGCNFKTIEMAMHLVGGDHPELFFGIDKDDRWLTFHGLEKVSLLLSDLKHIDNDTFVRYNMMAYMLGRIVKIKGI